jgi:chromosome segregation ATPase
VRNNKHVNMASNYEDSRAISVIEVHVDRNSGDIAELEDSVEQVQREATEMFTDLTDLTTEVQGMQQQLQEATTHNCLSQLQQHVQILTDEADQRIRGVERGAEDFKEFIEAALWKEAKIDQDNMKTAHDFKNIAREMREMRAMSAHQVAKHQQQLSDNSSRLAAAAQAQATKTDCILQRVEDTLATLVSDLDSEHSPVAHACHTDF